MGKVRRDLLPYLIQPQSPGRSFETPWTLSTFGDIQPHARVGVTPFSTQTPLGTILGEFICCATSLKYHGNGIYPALRAYNQNRPRENLHLGALCSALPHCTMQRDIPTNYCNQLTSTENERGGVNNPQAFCSV